MTANVSEKWNQSIYCF